MRRRRGWSSAVHLGAQKNYPNTGFRSCLCSIAATALISWSMKASLSTVIWRNRQLRPGRPLTGRKTDIWVACCWHWVPFIKRLPGCRKRKNPTEYIRRGSLTALRGIRNSSKRPVRSWHGRWQATASIWCLAPISTSTAIRAAADWPRAFRKIRIWSPKLPWRRSREYSPPA